MNYTSSAASGEAKRIAETSESFGCETDCLLAPSATAMGDPLPRLALDGVLVAEFNATGLCQVCRLWWHSMVLDGKQQS